MTPDDDIERALREVMEHWVRAGGRGDPYPVLAARVRERLEARTELLEAELHHAESVWEGKIATLQAQLDAREAEVLSGTAAIQRQIEFTANQTREIERLKGALEQERAKVLLEIAENYNVDEFVRAALRTAALAPPPAAPKEAQG